MIYQSGKFTVNEIIVHCTATPDGWVENAGVEAQRDENRAWHKVKGRSDIVYHHISAETASSRMGALRLPWARMCADIPAHRESRRGPRRI